MDAAFHINNRKNLLDFLPDGSVAVLFSGAAPHQSADAYYPFFASRNFLYCTGVDFEKYILVLKKSGCRRQEILYILPKDPHHERWNGRRFSPEEVTALSGIRDIRYVDHFENDFFSDVNFGGYTSLWLDMYKHKPDQQPDDAHRFARAMQERYPWLRVENLLPQLRRQRTIKAPCEIEAMKKAMTITREGILAMMRTSRPGMYEYEYKAEYDYALLKNGVLTPAFPPIISAGENNFCIHYYSYTGQAQDGDMILNDVGAWWDNEVNDVSRGWPCNGKFSREQAALYTAAYNTSQYMFGIIKPGMPMETVDETAHRFCCEELKKLGLLSSYDEIGRYMWHNGAHHIGYDVHDIVEIPVGPTRPGMVFCVDIGIYVEDWGIGFRLEDDCLVTEGGCVNLSAAIPRSIDEIESAMGK